MANDKQNLQDVFLNQLRKSKISDLKKFKGKIDLDIDLDTVRGRT